MAELKIKLEIGDKITYKSKKDLFDQYIDSFSIEYWEKPKEKKFDWEKNISIIQILRPVKFETFSTGRIQVEKGDLVEKEDGRISCDHRFTTEPYNGMLAESHGIEDDEGNWVKGYTPIKSIKKPVEYKKIFSTGELEKKEEEEKRAEEMCDIIDTLFYYGRIISQEVKEDFSKIRRFCMKIHTMRGLRTLQWEEKKEFDSLVEKNSFFFDEKNFNNILKNKLKF